MNNLKEYIYKRKSVRQYDMEEISGPAMEEIKAFIDTVKPLYPGIKVTWKIVSDAKNLLPVKAPHYILIYSEEQEGYLYNVGFMFQQVDLFLSGKGLGACWLGMARPREKSDENKDFVIAIGFGTPAESPYRKQTEFKRRPADEVYRGTDERLEAARLAPSATNSQNWFFDEKDGVINVYQKTLNSLQNVVYGKMNQIDIGIALAHIYISGMEQEKDLNFVKEKNHRDIKGFRYVGTVL